MLPLLLLLLQGEVLPPVMVPAGGSSFVPLLLLGLGGAASLTTEDWGHNAYHVSTKGFCKYCTVVTAVAGPVWGHQPHN
jgi:hypothetical protein